MRSPQHKAVLMASFVVLAWATVATAFKIALSGMSTALLLLIASVTTLLIAFFEVVRCGMIKNVLASMKDKRGLLLNMSMGLLNPFLYYLILFKAYSLLPAQIAQPINFSWQIVLILLLAVVMKERLRIGVMIGVAVSFGGVLILSTNNSASTDGILSVTGIILTIISTFIWASYWVFNLKSKEGSTVSLFKNFFFGTVYLLIFVVIYPESLSFNGVSILSGNFPDLKPLLAAIYTGCFEMGITFILWGKALQFSTNRAILTQLTYLAPVISLFIIYFVLGETISLYTVIGLSLIIVGLLISTLRIIPVTSK
jgi:Predicted permeases